MTIILAAAFFYFAGAAARDGDLFWALAFTVAGWAAILYFIGSTT